MNAIARDLCLANEEIGDFFGQLTGLFGGLGEFKPFIWWDEKNDRLLYLVRGCSYAEVPCGRRFSALLDREEIVGVSLEPFQELVTDIGNTYPGIGRDGRDFPLRPFIEISTSVKCLFPSVSRARVSAMLPKVREFVGIATVPFCLLQRSISSDVSRS